MLTLDTSGILAAADRTDPSHHAVTEAMAGERSLVLPATIVAEVTFMLRRRLGPAAERAFLQGAAAGQPHLDHGEDLERVLELTARYEDLDLSFANAAVVACAERHGGRILTLDRRDFDVVSRGEASITLLP